MACTAETPFRMTFTIVHPATTVTIALSPSRAASTKTTITVTANNNSRIIITTSATVASLNDVSDDSNKAAKANINNVEANPQEYSFAREQEEEEKAVAREAEEDDEEEEQAAVAREAEEDDEEEQQGEENDPAPLPTEVPKKKSSSTTTVTAAPRRSKNDYARRLLFLSGMKLIPLLVREEGVEEDEHYFSEVAIKTLEQCTGAPLPPGSIISAQRKGRIPYSASWGQDALRLQVELSSIKTKDAIISAYNAHRDYAPTGIFLKEQWLHG